MDAHAEGKSDVTLSAIIIRACALCGEKREQGKNCASCGNTDPPQVHDLGVIAARHDDPVKALHWKLFGQHAAARRVRLANKELEHGDDG
jgi:hypothetical protein